MKKVSILLATAALAASASAAVPVDAAKFFPEPFAYSQKVSPSGLIAGNATKKLAKAQADPSATIAPMNTFVYLLSPDGNIWMATVEYEYESVTPPGASFTENYIRGYKFNVYDQTGALVGTVEDSVVLPEGATRCAAIMLDATVSKKFFNSDNKPEIIVGVAYNKPDYTIDYETKVYTIGGNKTEEGKDAVICTIPGYIVASENVARDNWSEDFYMTFLEEQADLETTDYNEYLNSMNCHLTTYKKAGWGSSPSVLFETDVPILKLPGAENEIPYFMIKNINGTAYFVKQYYDKWFFVEPGMGGSDEITPDNSLILEISKLPSLYSTTLEEVQKTSIPMLQETPVSGAICVYYGVGYLNFEDDVIFNGTDFDFVVGTDSYTPGSDDFVKCYYTYDAAGQRVNTLWENVSVSIGLSDVDGYPSQIVFVDTDLNNNAIFNFVDVPSGEVKAVLPQALNGNSLSGSIDRVAAKDGYNYAIKLSHGVQDNQGDVHDYIAWFSKDGELIRIDDNNLGKKVDLAQAYVSADALSPYLFNTDEAQEYMYLVKRNIDQAGGSLNQEELVITSGNGETLLYLVPDAQKGNIASVSVVTSDTNPRLLVFYRNSSDVFTLDTYNLPLKRFQGGNGTAEDPYLIATVGDLQQIASSPLSSYRLVSDIDASAVNFSPIKNFSGKLDGAGHTISGLNINGNHFNVSLFDTMVEGSEVKDLTLTGVKFTVNSSATAAGVIAGKTVGATISNVHVYGLDLVAAENMTPTVGGLVGEASYRTAINYSSVSSANIDAPGSSVGGIVGLMRTGSQVLASAFIGTIHGDVAVGGIAGSTTTGDENILDCHVDADIVANNTVGGVVGEMARSTVARNYVEGTITADRNTNRFHDYGPCAGGVAGSLAMLYEAEDNPKSVIYNNYVNLSALKAFASQGTEEWPGQHNTLHRIVGQTSATMMPAIDDYTNDGDPIYGKNHPAEAGLKNNHVNQDIAAVSEMGSTTVEGISVAADELNREFFETTLGFAYGTSVEKPWNELSSADPALAHEKASMALEPEIYSTVGQPFDVALIIVSRKPLTTDEFIDQFTFTSSNEEVATATGNMREDGGLFYVEFVSAKEGDATLNVCGAEVRVHAKSAGVEDSVVRPSISISFTGNAVVAQDCRIEIYSTAGMAVAAGNGSVAVDSLSAGVYVAVATDMQGNRSSIKIVVR